MRMPKARYTLLLCLLCLPCMCCPSGCNGPAKQEGQVSKKGDLSKLVLVLGQKEDTLLDTLLVSGAGSMGIGRPGTSWVGPNGEKLHFSHFSYNVQAGQVCNLLTTVDSGPTGREIVQRLLSSLGSTFRIAKHPEFIFVDFVVEKRRHVIAALATEDLEARFVLSFMNPSAFEGMVRTNATTRQARSAPGFGVRVRKGTPFVCGIPMLVGRPQADLVRFLRESPTHPDSASVSDVPITLPSGETVVVDHIEYSWGLTISSVSGDVGLRDPSAQVSQKALSALFRALKATGVVKKEAQKDRNQDVTLRVMCGDSPGILHVVWYSAGGRKKAGKGKGPGLWFSLSDVDQ